MSWLTLLPPVIVICCALITRRMLMSLWIGIILASLIANHGQLANTVSLITTRFLNNSGLLALTNIRTVATHWNICIFIFLISIGTLINFLQITGVAGVYTHLAQRYVHDKRSTELASLILSCFFFIDDYFSALTVGTIMRPLAQRYHVHPVKMAFLTTAMAAPIAILSPLSSWIGEILLQLTIAGINPQSPQSLVPVDPFYVLMQLIPFLWYPILLIIGTWYLVIRRISFGPMRAYEHQTVHHPLPSSSLATSITFFDFFFPIGLLATSVVLILLITGNSWLIGGTHTLAQTLEHAKVNYAFFGAGLITVSSALVYFIVRRLITFRAGLKAIYQGFTLMLPSIIILIHIWTFGSMITKDLQTGTYIAHLLGTSAPWHFMPLLFFISAGLTAWMIGSAWATLGILIPIAVPMIVPHTLLHITFTSLLPLLAVLGAILSGSVMGTHFSLLSDTPLMAATSTGASHLEHLRTMAYYLAPVSIGCIISYTLVGFLAPLIPAVPTLLISLVTGIICVCGIFECAHYATQK